MKSVLISTPAYTGGVHAAYASAFGQTMLVLRNAGIAATPLFTVGESNINRERNRHLAEFLMNPEYTHLFIIDGDIAWNPYDALRILASPHEVTCSVYRVKGEPLRWAANFDAPMDMRDGYVPRVVYSCGGIVHGAGGEPRDGYGRLGCDGTANAEP